MLSSNMHTTCLFISVLYVKDAALIDTRPTQLLTLQFKIQVNKYTF